MKITQFGDGVKKTLVYLILPGVLHNLFSQREPYILRNYILNCISYQIMLVKPLCPFLKVRCHYRYKEAPYIN